MYSSPLDVNEFLTAYKAEGEAAIEQILNRLSNTIMEDSSKIKYAFSFLFRIYTCENPPTPLWEEELKGLMNKIISKHEDFPLNDQTLTELDNVLKHAPVLAMEITNIIFHEYLSQELKSHSEDVMRDLFVLSAKYIKMNEFDSNIFFNVFEKYFHSSNCHQMTILLEAASKANIHDLNDFYDTFFSILLSNSLKENANQTEVQEALLIFRRNQPEINGMVCSEIQNIMNNLEAEENEEKIVELSKQLIMSIPFMNSEAFCYGVNLIISSMRKMPLESIPDFGDLIASINTPNLSGEIKSGLQTLVKSEYADAHELFVVSQLLPLMGADGANGAESIFAFVQGMLEQDQIAEFVYARAMGFVIPSISLFFLSSNMEALENGIRLAASASIDQSSVLSALVSIVGTDLVAPEELVDFALQHMESFAEADHRALFRFLRSAIGAAEVRAPGGEALSAIESMLCGALAENWSEVPCYSAVFFAAISEAAKAAGSALDVGAVPPMATTILAAVGAGDPFECALAGMFSMRFFGTAFFTDFDSFMGFAEENIGALFAGARDEVLGEGSCNLLFFLLHVMQSVALCPGEALDQARESIANLIIAMFGIKDASVTNAAIGAFIASSNWANTDSFPNVLKAGFECIMGNPSTDSFVKFVGLLRRVVFSVIGENSPTKEMYYDDGFVLLDYFADTISAETWRQSEDCIPFDEDQCNWALLDMAEDTASKLVVMVKEFVQSLLEGGPACFGEKPIFLFEECLGAVGRLIADFFFCDNFELTQLAAGLMGKSHAASWLIADPIADALLFRFNQEACIEESAALIELAFSGMSEFGESLPLFLSLLKIAYGVIASTSSLQGRYSCFFLECACRCLGDSREPDEILLEIAEWIQTFMSESQLYLENQKLIEKKLEFLRESLEE